MGWYIWSSWESQPETFSCVFIPSLLRPVPRRSCPQSFASLLSLLPQKTLSCLGVEATACPHGCNKLNSQVMHLTKPPRFLGRDFHLWLEGLAGFSLATLDSSEVLRTPSWAKNNSEDGSLCYKWPGHLLSSTGQRSTPNLSSPLAWGGPTAQQALELCCCRVHLSPHAAGVVRCDPHIGTLNRSSTTISRALGLLINLVKSNLCLYYHTYHSLGEGALVIASFSGPTEHWGIKHIRNGCGSKRRRPKDLMGLPPSSQVSEGLSGNTHVAMWMVLPHGAWLPQL